MKQLIPKHEHIDDYYPSDVNRIVSVCLKNGYCISYNDANAIWKRHSTDYAAGWLILPEDDTDLFNEVLNCSLVKDEE